MVTPIDNLKCFMLAPAWLKCHINQSLTSAAFRQAQRMWLWRDASAIILPSIYY
jgi:hypothetical protein